MSKKAELGLLSLEISPEPAPEVMTAYGGLPLVLQTMRTIGVLKSIQRHVQVKQRERGFTEAQMVESLVVLMTVGGECLDDLNRLQADQGVAVMMEHPVPAPDTARNFLYAFHDEEAIDDGAEEAEAGPDRLHPHGDGASAGTGARQRRT